MGRAADEDAARVSSPNSDAVVTQVLPAAGEDSSYGLAVIRQLRLLLFAAGSILAPYFPDEKCCNHAYSQYDTRKFRF